MKSEGKIYFRQLRMPDLSCASYVEPVVVFCNSGNRSSAAASLLERLGLRVMNMIGGTSAWMEAGLPLAKCDEATRV